MWIFSSKPPGSNLIHPTHPLLLDPVRSAIEQAVTTHLGRGWRAAHLTDLAEFSSHPTALLSDGAAPVFAKLTRAANGLDQFEVELDGLRLLSGQAGALIPDPIGLVPVEGGVVMLLEGLREIERGPKEWRQIGQVLARIHQVQGDQFGYAKNGYFGPLFQDNRPTPDWLSFYIERRIWPRLVGAIDSGHLPGETIRQVERLIQRIPSLDLPPAAPCLLHGDAQKNNYITTARGPVVIDPAVFYGHPEYDLAYIDYFEPVPPEVFAGYREVRPIDPGFEQRRELWRVSAYLAIVQVEGESYLDLLTRAVTRYL